MSLLGQSQQLFPTSVQVTVHQARNLRVKGKNGGNDAYAIMQVAKDKFSTSVAEKSVAPVWKEEASFDLPLFHPGNAERCTLYIIVMHRAQVGLDKFLGQAVINLLELHDDKSRKKTQWFKLVDKNGKEDKVRGEVMLDIQFLRNNMSVSMLDLSMQDKPRSRMSKLKDKVRGKKKDGFSDSASAIVPSVSKTDLTDSEEDADAKSLNQAPGEKKKSKLKTLFVPKSNLHRNISQSMSTLGTLPEKNSSLSGSRSSGLNVDSPEGKKKFKFLGHKRSGSSDSKTSLGPFSVLGRSKQNINDQNNLCINGNHVYTEESKNKSGSTLSLNSSGKGSLEDIRKNTSDIPAESSKTINVPAFKSEPINKVSLEQQRHQEAEERRQAEEKRLAEVRRLEQEEKYRAEAKKLQEEEQRKQQEEQERRRRVIEDEARRKKQNEEERRREEERKVLEAAETQRLEDERGRAEERKRQEEASMSDRLTSLFGMIRKKEEKKEDVQHQAPVEQHPTPATRTNSGAPTQSVSHHSTNPFEDTSGPSTVDSESSAANQKFNRNPQAPSATVFLSRTAKVSAVKPRLSQSSESKTPDCQSPGQLDSFSVRSESTFTRVPAESSEAFSNLHLLLAPPNRSPSRPGSPRGSTEDLSSVELGRSSSSAMADQRRKAILPPSYAGHRTPTEESWAPVKNPVYVEEDGSPRRNKLSLPLPDYECLFPQRRHGVQGQTRWDHIVAEVNQKQRDRGPELVGPEMSVDGPEEYASSLKSHMPQETPAEKKPTAKPVSSKKAPAPAPPKQASSGVDFSQKHRQKVTPQSVTRHNPSVVPPFRKTGSPSNRMFREGDGNVAKASTEGAPSHRPQSQKTFDPTPAADQRSVQVALDKQPPTAKPRQRVGAKEPAQQEPSAVSSSIQTLSSVSKTDNKTTKNIAELDQLPYTEHKSKDGPGHLKQNQEDDGLFTGRQEKRQQKSEELLMRKDYLKDFSIENPAAHVALNDCDSENRSESRKEEEQIPQSPSFQRKNSQRAKKDLPLRSLTDDKPFMSQQESVSEMPDLPSGDVVDGSVKPKSQYDARTQSSLNATKDQNHTEDFQGHSAFSYSEPLPVVPEEPEAQTGNIWGGKTPLRAWVSPSEAQPVSTQYSNGSGLALSPRRPHPVKPMSSAEIQQPTIPPAVKEIKVVSSAPAITKMADTVSSGPYGQLTQEELISLVVKQQADLSKKDAKISELEQYIDNLLVRVMEEKPTILFSLNSAKQA